MSDYDAAIKEALRLVSDSQLSDGSWLALTGELGQDFRGRRQSSTFASFLILDALAAAVPGSRATARGADFILACRRTLGSFNYWRPGSSASKSQPYPDDLDDTSCALAALSLIRPTAVGPRELAELARLLTAAEQQAGGPYNTWLIDFNSDSRWQEIDLAVNANVGYLLSLHGVNLAALRSYAVNCLETGQLESKYYVGELPVLYFLTRWLKKQPLLAPKLESYLAGWTRLSLQQQALLLSSGCRAGLPATALRSLADSLAAALNTKLPMPEPFYIDPDKNGRRQVGTAEALLPALIAEALKLYQLITLSRPRPKSAPQQRRLPKIVTEDLRSIKDPRLRRDYGRRLLEQAAQPGVAQAANLMEQAGGGRLTADQRRHLNLGSLQGWLAYSAYDNLLDELDLSQIQLANMALRRSYQHFMQALPDGTAWQNEVADIFDAMDAANLWELDNARRVPDAPLKLPDYDHLGQLAARSGGHALASLGVLAAQFNNLKHPCYLAVKHFFKHYIIARQLNDDLHDWEADLAAGHLSYVVTQLLKNAGRHKADISQLRQRFWQQTFDEVAEVVDNQLYMAETQLRLTDAWLNPSIYQAWLDGLKRSSRQARQVKAASREFMNVFEGAKNAHA